MDATHAMPMVQPSVGRQAWNFARHFLEMCVAMCAVGTPVVLLVTRFAPSWFGWPAPATVAPEATLLLVALIYAVPMAAWMRFRGMAWRPIAEMAAAAIVVAVGAIALAWIGILPSVTVAELASPTICAPACAAMVVAMVARLDLYTGRSGHHH